MFSESVWRERKSNFCQFLSMRELKISRDREHQQQQHCYPRARSNTPTAEPPAALLHAQRFTDPRRSCNKPDGLSSGYCNCFLIKATFLVEQNGLCTAALKLYFCQFIKFLPVLRKRPERVFGVLKRRTMPFCSLLFLVTVCSY